MGAGKVYSAQAVTLLIAGLNVFKGLGKDTALEVMQEGEDVTYVQGLDGEGVFCFQPGGAIRLKITLLQTSSANGILSGLHIASKAVGGLVYPSFWNDGKGTSTGAGASAAITKMPDEKFGREADDVTWEIIVHDPLRFVGGH